VKTLIKVVPLFALVIAVGCTGGNRDDGSGSIASGGGGPQDNTGEVSLTTFAGEYELVVNHDTEELYVYTLPDRDNSYGPIAYGFSTPKEAFRLEKPDHIYILTSAAMSYGDLLEVSLAAETVEPIEHCVNIIDRSYEGAWIAYNKMHDLSHDLNPGEWRASSDGKSTARAETVRLTIEEVRPGTKWEDCCISEIEVW
jgi:hypothetical protein